MEVRGQFHAPATFSPEKKTPVPTEQENGCAPKPVLTLWEEKSLAVTGNRTATILVVQPAAHGLGKLNV